MALAECLRKDTYGLAQGIPAVRAPIVIISMRQPLCKATDSPTLAYIALAKTCKASTRL